MKYHLPRLLVFFCLLMVFPVMSHADSVFRLPVDFTSAPLEPSISYLVDPESRYEIGQVARLDPDAFTRLKGKTLNLGVIPAPCWVRFTLENPHNLPVELVLELGTTTINHADLYIPDGRSGYARKTAGDLHPISARDEYHRHITFRLSLAPGATTTFLLRLQTEAILETSFTLHARDGFVAKLPVEYFLLGSFYAAFAVAIFYNLFVYFSLRDRAYLLYVLYAACFCSLWLYLDGLGQMFLWPDHPWQQVWGARFANTSTCLFMVLFTMHFFPCRTNAPRLYRVFQVLAVLCVFNSIMIFILPLAEYKLPVRLAWLFAIPAVLVTAVVFWRKKFKRARYFLVAWLFVLLGASVFMLDMYLGMIPSSVFTRSAWRIASVVEIILLSLALADRINELNEESQDAQNRLLETERRLTKGLEQEVALRTVKLEERTRELQEVNVMLEELSRVDSLTGLYNRRFFDEVMEREWMRMLRHRSPLCLIMGDIDHFKLYNDSYGHQAGDACLKEIAGCILSRLRRSSDICVRYGGEEFVIVLAETDMEAGFRIAEQIRKDVEERRIPHVSETGNVTMSLGVAAVVPTTSRLPRDLIAMVDEALYASKKKGRNRVTAAKLETDYRLLGRSRKNSI
jgi:diguanylate cyclase (GGDEF)-like protein